MLSRAKKTENRVRGIYMTKMGLWEWLTADVTVVVWLLRCVRVCYPMDCSTPGFPILHHLLQFAETHVHWVGDVIQPSHPWSSLSPPAFSLSQHQGLSQRVCSSYQRPKYWSFTFSISPSNEYWGLIFSRIDYLISLQTRQLSRVFSSTTIWSRQFLGTQSFHLEKATAPHSSTLAWKIPWMEEPGGLQSMGVTKSQTRLSEFTFTFHFHTLEKEMATHSSVLAWRTPGMGEPGGLPSSMGSHRVRHD